MVVSWFSYRHSKRLTDASAHRSFSANRNSSKFTFLHVEKFKPNERKTHDATVVYTHRQRLKRSGKVLAHLFARSLSLSFFRFVSIYRSSSVFICIHNRIRIRIRLWILSWCCFALLLLFVALLRLPSIQNATAIVKNKGKIMKHRTQQMHAHGLKRQNPA